MMLLILVLTLSIVSAVGGGGGGGSGGGSSGGGSGGGTGGGSGPSLQNLKCTDTGVLRFQQIPMIDPVIVQAPDGRNITVQGSWMGTMFTSEEAEVRDAGEYIIHDITNGDKSLNCPGLKFSCKLVELHIQNCTRLADHTRVEFSLKNASTQDLKVEFSMLGSHLTYDKKSHSQELVDLTIHQEGNGKYSIWAPFLPNATVQLSLPECLGQHYQYAKKDCVADNIPTVAEQTGKQLKCGGMLSLSDRVRCRLALREEQRAEYDNFFPEECKSRADQDHCIQVYTAVQQCWNFPNGPSRINCVRRQLKLGDIPSEKANCNALDVGKRENCNQQLRDKVYALVKFRLYNLEEEGEKLMEEGKVQKEDLVAFVVKMETSKQKFNEAQTLEQRKAILMQAQQDWKIFVSTK